MRMRQAEQDMQTSLRGIAQRAEACPGHRFGNLYGLLNERNLHWCLRHLNKRHYRIFSGLGCPIVTD